MTRRSRSSISPTRSEHLAAGVGTAFVGLFSLFNIAGRFFWASLSDRIGRKQVYFAFFVLGVLCYAALTPLSRAGMIGAVCRSVCVIASMYGGGFATIPAYLADMFGTLFVGAIHGRLLTAWSTAGILGPVLVNYLHDSRLAEGITHAHVYDSIFYVLVAMLLVGLIANASIRPVAAKWHMSSVRGGAGTRRATGSQHGRLFRVLRHWPRRFQPRGTARVVRCGPALGLGSL